MLVKRLQDLLGGPAEVEASDGSWVSRRFLNRGDGLGYSLHDTLVRAGSEIHMHYAHHVEAVYCVGGEGELEDLETGERHAIRDGTLYVLNGHERHVLRGGERDLRVVCVFRPALTGDEVHGPDGAYPPSDEDA